MSVIPSSPIKLGSEGVGHSRVRRNRALSHSRNTVHLVRPSLEETIPVHARSLVTELVRDLDLDCIAVVGFK